MPLNKSGSKASVGENIKTEKSHGKSQAQAVAIALSVQRKAKGESAKYKIKKKVNKKKVGY